MVIVCWLAAVVFDRKLVVWGYVFKSTFYFRTIFRFRKFRKITKTVQRNLIYTFVSIINIFHWYGTCVLINEPMMIHYY